MVAAIARQYSRRHGSRCVRLGFAALGLFAVCYVGGPFLTLWRITQAVGSGDVVALQSLVDWTSVRQGLKDDIAEGVIGMKRETLLASNTLPPFGASFITGIAGTEVDRSVTPRGLVQVTRDLDPPSAGHSSTAPFPVLFPAILAAGFSTPRRFDLRVRAPFQDADEEPLHIRLAFQGWRWQVVRIWVPQDVMDRASSRT